MIPIVQPTLYDFEAVIGEFRQAWESGQVTTGVFTRRFEAAVEEKLQVPHAIMVQSCTAGLMLVLRAFELKGEVIMPAFTWTSTAHAAVWNGITPVFADISPGRYTLDPQAATQAVNSRTAAIMPVNVFGCPPDYEAFGKLAKDSGLRLIYDSAQGLGSRFRLSNGDWRYSGGFGDAEVFSLSPTKVVSAMEGGLITTHDAALAEKLCQMRDYGKTPDGQDIAWLGLSSRVPEINAIVARHSFAHLDQLISHRQQLIERYTELLAELAGVSFQDIPSSCFSSRNYFTIFIDGQKASKTRDQVYESLKQKGIQAKKYFYPAVHLQKVYQPLRQSYQGKLPVTEAAAATGLALPLYGHMTQDTVHRVASTVKDILQ